MPLILKDLLISFFLNFFLIVIFYRIPIMTKNGWISAGVLGTLLWFCLSWEGWLSVVIYLLLGSMVTKFGFKYKKQKGIAEKRGGRRGPENVLGSAATGLFFAIMIKINLINLSLLKIGFAASFSAKLADTFGSEIGKRFGTKTYLITNLKRVKNGTEGGISFEGTFASLIGSILMSYIMLILGIISLKNQFYVVSIAGFIATILESIIGAEFQDKYRLSNEVVNALQTSISSVIAISIYYLIFN